MKYWTKLVDYVKGSHLDMKKVNWPTKRETTRFTIAVIAISLAVAFYLGALDFIFAYILRLLI